MILAIRTDKPEAELFLLSQSGDTLDFYRWTADRTLADTLLVQINDLLKKNKIGFNDLKGVIIYSGTGSFTGLRIGTSVANAIAYSLKIPVAKANGEGWLNNAAKLIKNTSHGDFVTPDYNRQPNITKPRGG